MSDKDSLCLQKALVYLVFVPKVVAYLAIASFCTVHEDSMSSVE